jgi:hypothetical protein
MDKLPLPLDLAERSRSDTIRDAKCTSGRSHATGAQNPRGLIEVLSRPGERSYRTGRADAFNLPGCWRGTSPLTARVMVNHFGATFWTRNRGHDG